ncbi:hypothetical protein [Methyloversatilis discipulorum]|uniref:hypothetical protein n=1 Tax=Methyloversatilis discipulorum TaxID=1119528 RepID=UPI003AF71353
MRIAFVSMHPRARHYRQDASFVYRCENIALAVRSLGHEAELMHLRELYWRGRFDAVMLLRPRRTFALRLAVAWLRRLSTRVFGDFDDLVFDPGMSAYRPSVLAGKESLSRVRAKFALHSAALDMMDGVTLSTSELVRRYRALYPQGRALRVPNTPHRTWLDVEPSHSEVVPSISYFSGTHTHDADFKLVLPALQSLLDEMPRLTVRVVGPLETHFRHPRLLFGRRLDFRQYVDLVRNSYLTIAPLVDTPFTRCKSAIKVLESAVLGVPALASPIGEYSELDIDGIARVPTPSEWEPLLRRMLDPTVRHELASGLRGRVLERFDSVAVARDIVDFVAE